MNSLLDFTMKGKYSQVKKITFSFRKYEKIN